MQKDEAIGFSLLGLYAVGVPVAIGVALAKGVSPFLALYGSPLWPATALAWLGYWLAS